MGILVARLTGNELALTAMDSMRNIAKKHEILSFKKEVLPQQTSHNLILKRALIDQIEFQTDKSRINW